MALVREALARGHRVRASSRSREAPPQIAALGIEWTSCDLGDPTADFADLVAGCDSVIHAAALSASWGPRRTFEWINVEGTRALLSAARSTGARRFVFVSSPSIFAALRDRPLLGEHAEPARPPLNHYARTKMAAERLVLAANDAGLATCALRPRALVGPGDRVILPRLAQMASRPRLPLPGGGTAQVELTDLRDAAWALAEAEERAPALGGRAISISGGQPIAVRDLARAVAQALGCAPRLVALPLPVARVLASALEQWASLTGARTEPLLTRYTLATMAYSQTIDPEPARRLLGFTPCYVALDTLLAEARALAGERR